MRLNAFSACVSSSLIKGSSIILIGVPPNTPLTVANLLFIVVTSVTSMGLILYIGVPADTTLK